MAWLDGQAGDAAPQVEDQIATCSECRNELERQRDLKADSDVLRRQLSEHIGPVDPLRVMHDVQRRAREHETLPCRQRLQLWLLDVWDFRH